MPWWIFLRYYLLQSFCNRDGVSMSNQAISMLYSWITSNFIKTPSCSSIKVDGSVHEFLVGDASHPNMKEFNAMLKRKKITQLQKFHDWSHILEYSNSYLL